MARYLRKLGLFLLIQTVIAILAWRFSQPPNHNHYLASLADKHHALLHRPGPRLILVGGSSTAFGVCSPELKVQLRVEPINLGVHMSAGLEFMLSHVEHHLRAGDTVLLCPETQLLCAPLLPQPRFVDELLGAWPPAADYLPAECLGPEYVPPGWKDYCDRRALQEFGQRFHTFRRHAGRLVRGLPPKNPQNVYFRSSFNQYGDAVAHHGREPQSFEVQPIIYDEARVRDAICRMNRFADACQQRGGKVYFAYGPMLDESLAASQVAIQAIHEQLAAQLRVPILLRPEETTLPRSEFFDTHLHLTAHGAQCRTRRLVEQLRPHLSLASRPSETRRLGR